MSNASPLEVSQRRQKMELVCTASHLRPIVIDDDAVSLQVYCYEMKSIEAFSWANFGIRMFYPTSFL